MNLVEHFNKVAKEYDKSRRIFIPCFDEFYDESTNFIASTIRPRNVLDLGAGTGLLTCYWFNHFPQANYVITDIADEMLDVARIRFENLDNVRCEVSDYRKELPKESFDTIISALSIHHLEDSEKQVLFQRIYEKLPEKGVFVNYDQFCGESSLISQAMDHYWISYLEKSKLTSDELDKWRGRRMLDKECSVSSEIEMLKAARFTQVECIYRQQKFAVILAIK